MMGTPINAQVRLSERSAELMRLIEQVELLLNDAEGEIRGQSDEQLRNQVGCLNLVTNAIIVWNTVYIEKVVQQLQQEGRVLNEEDLMHIWPTRYAHVNVYGRYHFELEHVGKKRPFRSLHPSGFQA